MKSIPSVCAGFSIMIGVSVLVGWFFDIILLKSIVPGFVAMKVNTAIGFVCAGGSLLLLTSPSVSPERAQVGQALALVVTLIGALTLGEEVFEWQLGIDELLFEDNDLTEVFKTTPGRMAVSSMVAFLFLGLALLTINWRPWRRFALSDLLALLVFSISSIAALEYSFGRGIIHPFIDDTRMAVHTFVTFFVLCSGVLAARPERGLVAAIKARVRSPLELLVYVSLALGLLALLATGGAAFFAAQDTVLRSSRVDHTYMVRRQLGLLHLKHQDMQTGQRGYVITGNPKFLEHYEHGRKEADHVFRELVTLVRDNPAQTARLELLNTLHQQHIDWATRIVDVRRSSSVGTGAAGQMIASGQGKQLMDALRIAITQMDAEEERLLQERSGEERASIARMNWTILASTLFSLFVVGFAGIVIHRDFGRRQRAERMINEQNELLEQRVHARTAQLEESEARLQATVENLSEGVIVSGKDGRLLQFNRAAMNMHGFTSRDEYQRMLPEFTEIFELSTMDGAFLSLDQWPLARVLRGETLNDLEVCVRQIRDGWQKVFSYGGTLVRDTSGHPIMAVLTVRDVSDRLEKEQAVRAQEVAESANLAKSLFLANMSHELRTPLNAIIGYSEMLAEDAASKEDRQTLDDLHKIQGAGHHLLELINDVLDLSKIEAGKMVMEAERFSVPALVEEVTTMVAPLMEKNANDLQVDCDTDMGEICTDSTRLRQVLFNLLSNAAKFTSKGRIKLKVMFSGEGNEKIITFTIIDSGIGMTTEQLNRLFQPFTQADTSTTRHYGGTGLGLTISQQIAEMLGGEITVQSTPGKGSIFTLAIPVNLPQINQTNFHTKYIDQAFESQSTQSKSINKNTTILVIDNNAEARYLLSKFLVKSGWKVITAENGETGLQLAREVQPAAIILDIIMPGLNGWEVMEILKDDPELNSIPVIICTVVDDKHRGFALGATDYLMKPVKSEQLLSVLNNCFTDNPGIQ